MKLNTFVKFCVISSVAVWSGVISTSASAGIWGNQPWDQGEMEWGAAEWNCEKEDWVGAPTLGSDNIFRGTIAVNCLITESQKSGLVSLDTFLLQQVAGAKIIHAGPIQEYYEGLPAVRYDVTVDIQNEHGTVVMRQDVHLATDRISRLMFATFSTNIDASGMAGYMRKVDAIVDVKPGPKQKAFSVRASTYMEVAKPWYVPRATFLKEATKAALDQFKGYRDKVIPELAGNL